MLTCEFEREAEACAKVTTSYPVTPTSTVASSPGITICQSSITIPQFTETFLEQNLSK